MREYKFQGLDCVKIEVIGTILREKRSFRDQNVSQLHIFICPIITEK